LTGFGEWEEVRLIEVCRFVSPDIAEKYDLFLPEYEGIDQVVEVASSGEKL
jgi:hypothetical protein